MSVISIEPFNAEWESCDDKGKRHRHECTVVGINDSDEFVVVAQDDDGRFGTFTIRDVWPCGPRPAPRKAA